MADNTCMALVRAHARDRYLATLFAPDKAQEHLFALYAFDAELARIPSLVSEPQIGEIRLQWWHDTVEAIYENEAVDHPVAQALAITIAKAALPKQPLLNAINARSRDLYADPMPNLNDLEGYLGETRSAIIQMAAQILGGNAAQSLANASGFGGVASGIAEILEAKPVLPHEGNNLIPAMPLMDLLAHAQMRLVEYQKAFATMPRSMRPAFMPLATTGARLKKLLQKGPGNRLSPLRSQWLIWRAR